MTTDDRFADALGRIATALERIAAQPYGGLDRPLYRCSLHDWFGNKPCPQCSTHELTWIEPRPLT